MKALLAGITLAACGLAACGTGATYRTTDIVPRGHTQWVGGLQVAGVASYGLPMGEGAIAPLPEVALGARHAIADRVELQLSGTMLPTPIAQTGSLELGGKAKLVEQGRWSLAAGAAAGYRIAQLGGAIIEDVYATVPVIGAVALGRHHLVLSLDGGYHRAYSSGAPPVGLPFIGESIGFQWQLAKRWALLPELGTAWSPTPNSTSEDSRLFHVGVAALFTR